MNGTTVDDLFPIVKADIGDLGVPNPGRIHTNRYHADAGNLTAQPAAAVEPFRPYTQVLDLKRGTKPELSSHGYRCCPRARASLIHWCAMAQVSTTSSCLRMA